MEIDVKQYEILHFLPSVGMDPHSKILRVISKRDHLKWPLLQRLGGGGAGKWLGAGAYVSVVNRLVACPTSVLLALAIYLLSACLPTASLTATCVIMSM